MTVEERRPELKVIRMKAHFATDMSVRADAGKEDVDILTKDCAEE